ncbi:hypothetical protein JOC77_003191 [Peribacillus deserti]|uniref:Permease n=1 Tax=Peribacillus deserti TaxID=673318 RepID=A0ABS2QKW1_9BACI|nr:hypothetical protein [Peribacillus deserti]MBM7693747.1 hypothetical protein [Peribacillus deserti]
MNAVLFFSTGLVLYICMFFMIPYLHILVMFLAVILSVFLWMIVTKTWEGTTRNRLKMGAVGSSFFILLALFFLYWLMNLKPSYPGEDTFMEAIGLFFAIIVTAAAWITCFVITGISKKKTSL